MSIQNINKFVLVVVSATIFSCGTKQEIVIPKETEFEEVMLDPIEVDGSDPRTWQIEPPVNPYQPSAKRTFDLLHTKLDLKFDWSKQYVIGKAELDLKPMFYKQDSLVLDAKTMEINSVKNRDSGQSLRFKNTGENLVIYFDRSITKENTIKLFIDYVAKPNEGPISGSAAITSDKGLFFINPKGEEKDKPMQIWTQGETENNSKWFPTIDKPNERCTEEITLTVEDKYITLSNGKLVSSVKNNDGTRTDYWKQDKPHAPYLFMIAVGEFAVVQDKWKDIPLQYIVEKPYAPYAKEIFNHTPEMLTYFSEKLKVPYPWDKYSQIITRDYVSGAMENTSAVIFGEFIQKTDRELIDNNNDHIVAHEMFHHWFGNLVTTESWSNLTLNEGFANYSEYLWDEYKYGKLVADEHRSNELNGYLSTPREGLHPLIHFRYANKEDMFDAHSYNKGGLVLHYLRSIVGDEAFFESLHQYLKRNEYTAVEVDELRMAFEDVTGEDLNWFFDQWYLKKGHPSVKVDYSYDAANKKIVIEAKQSDNIFDTPYDVAIYSNSGGVTYHKVWIKDSINTIILSDISEAPAALVFDGKNVVPGEVEQKWADKELLTIVKYSKNYLDLEKAFTSLNENTTNRKDILAEGLKHKNSTIKAMALNQMTEDEVKVFKDQIVDLSQNAEHSQVRLTATSILSILEVPNKSQILKNILEKEKAFPVIGAALVQMSTLDNDLAVKYCKMWENESYLSTNIAAIYMTKTDPELNNWFLSKISKGSIYEKFDLINFYNSYLMSQSDEFIKTAIDLYNKVALDMGQNKYNRYIGAVSLFSLKNLMITTQSEGGKKRPSLISSIDKYLKEIKITEKDAELIERYAEF